MQKIEYKEFPSPHVVVENFLTVPAARECLAEAQWLEPVFEPARVQEGPEPHDIDSCEECTDISKTIRLSTRSNEVVYLDAHYQGKRSKSVILSQIEEVLHNRAFLRTFTKLPNMFPIVAQTTHMETVLSSYGKCDFYGWHKDTITEIPQSRVITCVLHFNTEPKQYQGGELILTGETLEDQLAYPPVHNTAIFFESNKCVHAVDTTTHEGAFKDSRFSINLWLGFSNEPACSHKYR